MRDVSDVGGRGRTERVEAELSVLVLDVRAVLSLSALSVRCATTTSSVQGLVDARKTEPSLGAMPERAVERFDERVRRCATELLVVPADQMSSPVTCLDGTMLPPAAGQTHRFTCPFRGSPRLPTVLVKPVSQLPVIRWHDEIGGSDHTRDLRRNPEQVRGLRLELTTAREQTAFNARFERSSALDRHVFSNGWLWASLLVVVVLQVCAVNLPLFQSVLRATELSLNEWAIAVGIAASIFVLDEMRKLGLRGHQ